MKQYKILKIGIVTLNFHPVRMGTSKTLSDLSVGLKKKGYDISVYTAQPSYDIRKKLNVVEDYNGVKIYRLFTPRFDSRMRMGLLQNGLMFFFIAFLRILLSKEKRILLIGTSPPFLPYLGYFLKKIKRKRYIIIAHDIWPEIGLIGGFLNNGIFAKIWLKSSSWVYQNADIITTLSKEMSNVIKRKIKKESYSKIEIIENFEDENFIYPIKKEDNWFSKKHGLIGKFAIVYSGNIGFHHGLDILIDAAEFLTDETLFLIIGDGNQKERLIQKTKQKNLQNVNFLPVQPYEKIPFTMTSGDVIVVCQQPGTENFCVVGKIYTALAAGKPILAIINKKSEIARIVKKYQCGIVVNNNDTKGVVDAILRLRENKNLCEEMGKKSRQALENKFTLSHAVEKYNTMLKKMRKHT